MHLYEVLRLLRTLAQTQYIFITSCMECNKITGAWQDLVLQSSVNGKKSAAKEACERRRS